MKTVEISLFGKKYKFKVDNTGYRSCGRCENGLVRTVKYHHKGVYYEIAGLPFIEVNRCHCHYGRDYSVTIWHKGERMQVQPKYPEYVPGKYEVLSHARWPKPKEREPEWEF